MASNPNSTNKRNHRVTVTADLTIVLPKATKRINSAGSILIRPTRNTENLKVVFISKSNEKFFPKGRLNPEKLFKKPLFEKRVKKKRF